MPRSQSVTLALEIEMTEEEYFERVSKHLGEFTESAVNLIRESAAGLEAGYWAFVVYPERFHSELGIELRRIFVKEDNSTDQDYLLPDLSGLSPYSIGEELNPQDFSSEPEERFDLLTKGAIRWIEGFLTRCDFRAPVYAGGPDDLRFYSFREKGWVELPFWI